jgi:hypothetical protein
MKLPDDSRPVLTLMPDYGFGPFLWINREPRTLGGVGGNCCSADSACGEHPLSRELLADLSRWVRQFERAPTRETDNAPFCVDLDWESFHERGLVLAKRLKTEVGEAWRVVYEKPKEDPNCRVSERREILMDGSLGLYARAIEGS